MQNASHRSLDLYPETLRRRRVFPTQAWPIFDFLLSIFGPWEWASQRVKEHRPQGNCLGAFLLLFFVLPVLSLPKGVYWLRAWQRVQPTGFRPWAFPFPHVCHSDLVEESTFLPGLPALRSSKSVGGSFCLPRSFQRGAKRRICFSLGGAGPPTACPSACPHLRDGLDSCENIWVHSCRVC